MEASNANSNYHYRNHHHRCIRNLLHAANAATRFLQTTLGTQPNRIKIPLLLSRTFRQTRIPRRTILHATMRRIHANKMLQALHGKDKKGKSKGSGGMKMLCPECDTVIASSNTGAFEIFDGIVTGVI
jgi:hypothetical protein